ncbi:unnamed protein product [Menidia menidia]|uniref:(Atlantic silverside) hypothetical protein n=1 Tax=Menidia menidia TaxID=238744 RepID=A0A8S4B129_9TELE|nr:unnamed protein product [Menidia menidia]
MVHSAKQTTLLRAKRLSWVLLPIHVGVDVNRTNRSVDDTINLSLHHTLMHLDQPSSYVRALFVDYSSAFNIILPDHLHSKLLQLHVPSTICEWIGDFLTNRNQQLQIGSFLSASLTTSAPQALQFRW